MKQTTATKTAWFVVLLLTYPALPATEAGDTITVQLRINRNYEQDQWTTIKFENERPAPGAKAERTTRFAKAPGGTLVGLETVADQPNTYLIKVDSNGDGNLINDVAQVIQPNATVQVTVSRRWENKEEPLPYRITYSRYVDEGKAGEILYWRPQYCAEGRIKNNGCESLFVVLDNNGTLTQRE